jgi:hypothetical protein
MIVSSDPDYLDTKLVKQGIKKLDPTFQELADWIDLNFKTKVLNVYYELIKVNKNQPRLSIIFEFDEEAKKFQDANGFTDESKEKIIIDKFIEITSKKENFLQRFFRLPVSKFDTDRMFVIFQAFEPIARQEVNRRIPQTEVDDLKQDLKSKNVWEIYREFEMTTFFFYTDLQIQEHNNDGTAELIKRKYYQLLKMYDAFDYIKFNDIFIALDSKENFDKNFESNWFWYSRR